MHTGFRPNNPTVHRAYNLLISTTFFLAGLPVFALICVALLLTQGTGIFYRGERLGKDGKVFNILKFRTLDTAKAQLLTANKVLPKDSRLETPLGKYLRISRLDELPQIINVILGDMNIVGPRPVRAQIAEAGALETPNYNLRFTVKPGLCGHTQAYMSHGTSKQMRARYNNILCQAPVRYGHEIVLLTRVALSVFKRALSEMVKALGSDNSKADARRVAEAFDLKLASLDGGKIHRVMSLDPQHIEAPGLSIGDEATERWLSLRTASGCLRRVRVKLKQDKSAGPGRFTFSPVSNYGSFIIERYLLDMVVVTVERPKKKKPQRIALTFGRNNTSAPAA